MMILENGLKFILTTRRLKSKIWGMLFFQNFYIITSLISQPCEDLFALTDQ